MEKSGRMENENRKNYLYFIYFIWIPQCSYVKMCRKCVLTPNQKIGNKRWIPETSFILSKTNEHNEFEIIHIKHTNTLARTICVHGKNTWTERKNQSRSESCLLCAMLSLDTTLFCVWLFEYEIIRIQADMVIISSPNSTFLQRFYSVVFVSIFLSFSWLSLFLFPSLRWFSLYLHTDSFSLCSPVILKRYKRFKTKDFM